MHILFTVNNNDVARLREDYSVEHRKMFSVGHHEEVALDLSHRFYTVTGDTYNDYELASMAEASSDPVGASCVMQYSPFCHWLCEGTVQRVESKDDDSRSADAFNFMRRCYREGGCKQPMMPLQLGEKTAYWLIGRAAGRSDARQCPTCSVRHFVRCR